MPLFVAILRQRARAFVEADPCQRAEQARQRARALLRRRRQESSVATVRGGPLDAGQHIDRQQPGDSSVEDSSDDPAFESKHYRGLFASVCVCR